MSTYREKPKRGQPTRKNPTKGNRSLQALTPNKSAKSDKPGTTRAEQKESARQAILSAAADLFSKTGFEGTSTNAIAIRSGISKQNLLYHFGSKEQLWRETVDWIFAAVDAYYAEKLAAEADAAPLSLRALVTLYYGACRHYPAHVMIPMIEGINPGWRTDWIAERHLSRHVEGFAYIAENLMQSGALPRTSPLHLQSLLGGGAQLFFALAPLWKNILGEDTRRPGFIDTYADTIVTLLEATRERPEASKKGKVKKT